MDWSPLALSLGFRRLAVGQAQILGLRLALAMVVLDPPSLVDSLAHHRLAMVAGLVALVGLALVALALAFLAFLVGHLIQRTHHLTLAPPPRRKSNHPVTPGSIEKVEIATWRVE